MTLDTATIADRAQRSEAARAARREDILLAARHVFAERGFRGTTIADIAEAAGIALGTIYNYFPSKEDVFTALNQHLLQIITEALSRTSGTAESLSGTVRRGIYNVFDVCSENRDLVRLVVLNTDPESAATRRIRAAEADRHAPIVRVLGDAAKQGLIRDADPCVMTRMILGLAHIAVYQAFVLSDGAEADKYRDACADMVTAYLTPPIAATGE